MYNTILCAIEVGKEGKQVLAYAQALAAKCGGKLLVISVMPYSFLEKDYQKKLKEEMIPKFEQLTEEFNVSKKSRFFKMGKPYEEICHLAEKKKTDLIVLGTHSKKGVRALLGSTANGVANNAPCDVTLVRMA